MRSITCISAVLALGLTMAVTAPVAAQTLEGCYIRDYDAAHLAANPDQIVSHVEVRFVWAEDQVRRAQITVDTADQGHVGREGMGGLNLTQVAECFADPASPTGWSCGVECDGGIMSITRLDAEVLEFRTDYLMVGDEADVCAPGVDLAERPGVPVTYRLFRQSNRACR